VIKKGLPLTPPPSNEGEIEAAAKTGVMRDKETSVTRVNIKSERKSE
jgi:hypothetical protein